MDLVMVALRVLHILAGTFWAGAALMMVGFLAPTIQASGPEGGKVMQGLMQRSRFPTVMALAALVTTICGVVLFWRVSGGLQASWLATGQGVGLTISSLAGIVALVEGLAITNREAMRLAALGKAIQAAGGPPSPAQMAQMRETQEKIARGGEIGAVLLAVSVIGMAAARYL